jgi:hypothetical protein
MYMKTSSKKDNKKDGKNEGRIRNKKWGIRERWLVKGNVGITLFRVHQKFPVTY